MNHVDQWKLDYPHLMAVVEFGSIKFNQPVYVGRDSLNTRFLGTKDKAFPVSWSSSNASTLDQIKELLTEYGVVDNG